MPKEIKAYDVINDKAQDEALYNKELNKIKAQDKAQDKIIGNIINYCQKEKTIFEIMNYVGFKNRTRFGRDYIKPLVKKGILKMTIPDKPTSKYQKYIANK